MRQKMRRLVIDILSSVNYIEQSKSKSHNRNLGISAEIDSCFSVLEQDSTQRLIPNLKITFANFVSGFKRLFRIRNQKGMKTILKSSLFVLVTAKSACILTADCRFDILSVLHTSLCSSCPLGGGIYSSGTCGIEKGKSFKG
jgi:hypothetical protein